MMMGKLSMQMKFKLFLAGLLVLAALAATGFWYFSYYTKTPDYSIKMIQEAIAHHDTDKFQKYVDEDHLLDGSAEALMEGMIDSEKPMSEDAKSAVSGFTKMFKAPLVLSFKGMINHYVATGEWNTQSSSEAVPIDLDLVLSKSGLKDTTFRKVDYVAADKEAGTAMVGVRVFQQEANDEFVLEVKFVRTDQGVWRASEITNFRDFVVFIMKARTVHLQGYVKDTADIIKTHDEAAAGIEKEISDTLAGGTLGNNDVRSHLKSIMLEKMVPEWQKRKEELAAVEAPLSAQTLHKLRLKICDLRIAYAQGYAAWMDDKKAATIRDADEKLRQARTLEREEEILTQQGKEK